MKEPDHVKKQATKSVAEMVVSNLTPFSSIDGEGIEMTHKMYHTKITAIKLIKKRLVMRWILLNMGMMRSFLMWTKFVDLISLILVQRNIMQRNVRVILMC